MVSSRKKTKIVNIAVLFTFFISLIVGITATYKTFGHPVSLRHAVDRIFDDHVDEYKISGDTLIVRADNIGWDGSEWTEKEAIREGQEQINKLKKYVPRYSKKIERVKVTITYLKQPEIFANIKVK
jgi:hypothetical protein